ncbi:MAG: endonuclease [Frankiales bacterium]|nr:endonuclease [Frankiales bacterium]
MHAPDAYVPDLDISDLDLPGPDQLDPDQLGPDLPGPDLPGPDLPDLDISDLDVPDAMVPEPDELDRWLPRDIDDASDVDGVESLSPVASFADEDWSRWAALPARDAAATMRAISPDALEVDAAVELAVLAQRVIGWATAVQHRALAQVGAQDRSAERWYQDVVACALHIPSRTAQHRLAMASTLTRDLPDTLSALAEGVISPQHAEAIGEVAWTLPSDQHAQSLEAAVLARAGEQSVAQLRRALRRAAIDTDPAIAQRRHAQAKATRQVKHFPAEDGMSELRAYLPAPDAVALFTRLDAATRLLPRQDLRTRDQQRADLLVDAVLNGLPSDALPTHHGRTPTIQVTVAAGTLLGLDEQAAHLAGYGPITAETARVIAHDPTGTWRRLLTDADTGALLDYGRTTYRPPRALTDFIQARDQVCIYPSCQQPGYRCEVDHQKPFDNGGHTCRTNTALGCKRHHQGKTKKIWDYRINPDDSHTWTLPGGREYTSYPPHRTVRPRSNSEATATTPPADRHNRGNPSDGLPNRSLDDTDTATHDAGVADTGTHDAGVADTATHDAGAADTGTHDAGAADTGTHDAGAAGTETHDTGIADSAIQAIATADSRVVETGTQESVVVNGPTESHDHQDRAHAIHQLQLPSPTASSRFTVRPTLSDEQLRQMQDAQYIKRITELRLGKRLARSTARRTGDRAPVHQANRELHAEHTERQRILRNRRDPSYPPF